MKREFREEDFVEEDFIEDELDENLCFPDAELTGRSTRVKPKTELVEETDEDLGDLNIGDEEEAYRRIELEQKVEPLVKERVSEELVNAVQIIKSDIKREVAEITIEHNELALERTKKLAKKFTTKQKVHKVFNFALGLATALGVIFLITNHQTRPLIKEVISFVTDLFTDEETSSNDVIKELGDVLNDANTKVIYVEEEVE